MGALRHACLALLLVSSGAVVARAADERAAPPAPEVSLDDGDNVVQTILGLHASLSRHMPAPVAWAVFAAPLWLPLLLWLFVRWVRRSRAEGSRRRPSRLVLPRLPEISPPPELPPLQLEEGERLFLAPNGKPGALELALVTLGHSDEVLAALRHELETIFDPQSWFAEGAEQHAKRQELAARWVRRLARDRVEAWLRSHPLVVEPELEPHLPTDLELASLDDLCLVYSSGLGADLDAEQEELVRKARRALKLSFRGAHSAFVLELVAQRVDVPALLGASGTDATARYPLVALLFGEQALRQAKPLGLVEGIGEELEAQLVTAREPKDRDLPAEGPLLHLVSRLGPPPPLGSFVLAALAGGRVGVKEVKLQLSRRIKDLAGDLRQGLAQVGVGAATALAKVEGAGRKRMLQNLAALLGDGLLTRELELLAEREKSLERGLARSAIWPQLKAAQSPEMALLRLYKRRLTRQREAIGGAIVRALRVFGELGYAGEGRLDQEIAATRFGYAITCFGPELVAGLPQLPSQVEEIRPRLF